MLHAKTSEIHHNQEENNEARSKSSIAVVPIATPIVAGPGAITTITINTHRYQDDIDKIYIPGVCVIIAFTLWICFYFSSFFSRILGKSGINIATSIMGIVLSAIAIEMIFDGIKKMLPGLS